MEKLSMCRICLATDVRFYSIASHLRDMFERISSMTFKSEDRRPLVACYICHARLQNCYRLRTSCQRSEKLLTEMLSSGVLKPKDVLSRNSFSVVSTLHLSLGPAIQNSTQRYVKKMASEIIYDAELKDIKMEPQEEHDAQIDDIIQCSHLENPLNAMKREPDDVETDAEDLKLEIEDTVFEENELNGTVPSLLFADYICPKKVKVVLERIDLKNPRTGIPVLKKLAETNSHLFTDPENDVFNKNIVFGELIAANHIQNSNDKIDGTLHLQRHTKLVHHESYKQTFKSNICSINKPYSKSKAHSETTSEKFQCDLCKKCLRTRTTFRRHMYIHANRNRFQCDICNKCFKSKQYLILHIGIHTNDQQFQCDVCNKYFKSKQYLTLHMYIHTDKQYQCDVCNKNYWNKYYFAEHMFTHRKKKRFQCNVCSRRFTHNGNLRRHMFTHTDTKRFQCGVCNQRFREKHQLIRHINSHKLV